MRPDEATEIIRGMAEQAAAIGAHRLDFGHSTGSPGAVDTLRLVPGAVVQQQVFRRDSEEPYVLESAELVLVAATGRRIRVYGQWSRPLTRAELDAFEHATAAGGVRRQAPPAFAVLDLPPGGGK